MPSYSRCLFKHFSTLSNKIRYTDPWYSLTFLSECNPIYINSKILQKSLQLNSKKMHQALDLSIFNNIDVTCIEASAVMFLYSLSFSFCHLSVSPFIVKFTIFSHRSSYRKICCFLFLKSTKPSNAGEEISFTTHLVQKKIS